MAKVALILGSAPKPNVAVKFDDIYCANGSVASAYKYIHKGPVATIVGGNAHQISTLMNLLKGLNCGVVYARSMRKLSGVKDVLKHIKNDRDGWLINFKRKFKKTEVLFDDIVLWRKKTYFDMIASICGEDAYAVLEEKDLSSGVLALFLAVSTNQYDKIIMAGFKFNVEYEYQKSSNAPSGHFKTDVALLKMALSKNVPIYTTEEAVTLHTGIPLISE